MRLSSMIPLLPALLLTGSFLAHTQAEESDLLTIGSKAPAIDVEHWVSDNDGAFPHVKEFKEGNVYVIEFWATWCGPCIGSMPHISELQQQYADKGVQVISISDEPVETVEAFLAKPVRGDDSGKTYQELTSNYCLTTDPDRSVSKDYMQAAGQNGIPTAFIVGKTGLIEWIGHPMSMDQTIAQVVSGDWDRKAFAEQFIAKQKFDANMQKAMAAFRQGDADKAVSLIEEIIPNAPSAQAKAQLQQMRTQMLIMGGGEKGAAALKDLASKQESTEVKNRIAWSIYQMSQRSQADEQMVAAATEVAREALKAEPKSAKIMDTLAHLLHSQGELQEALKIQREAAEIGAEEPEADEQINEFLKQLEEEEGK